MKSTRFLTAAAVFMVGLLLDVYGVFALTFNEEGSSSTYVTLSGHRLDAHLVGAVSLVIGLIINAVALALLRGGRQRRSGP